MHRPDRLPTHPSPREKGASVGKKARRARLAASDRARRHFDKRRRKCRLSFDKLHRRLIGSDSLETIAKDAGISGARLTYLYNSLFVANMGFPSHGSQEMGYVGKQCG